MHIFYKIRKDGQAVYVMQTLFNKSETYLENNIKSFKEISVEEFLKKFTGKTREKFEKDISRVREIADKNMFSIFRFSLYDPRFGFTRTVYNIDGKGFQEDDTDYKEYSQKQDAINYCIEKYGKEFIEKYGYIFEDIEDADFSFADNELISQRESSRLYDELNKLTKVNDLKEKIEEYSIKNKR